MKKILLSLFIAVVAVGANAQKLNIDKQDNGIRTCGTYLEKVCSKGFRSARMIKAGLICEAHEKGDTVYQIIIQHSCVEYEKDSKPTVDVSRKLLLKSSNGKILELENCREVGPADYTFDVSGSQTIYYTYMIYPINREDIMYIINNEITGARLETNLSLLDFNKTSFSKVLKKELQEIDKALQQKKGLYDGF